MSAATPDDEAARRLQGHLDAECWCDLIPVEPHRVGDPHPAGTFDLTAPTPGTPATNGLRDAVYTFLYRTPAPPEGGRSMLDVFTEFVAGREAAAERRGAEKALRDAFAFMDRMFEIRPVESEFSKGFAYAMSGVLEHLDERAEAVGAAAVAGES